MSFKRCQTNADIGIQDPKKLNLDAVSPRVSSTTIQKVEDDSLSYAVPQTLALGNHVLTFFHLWLQGKRQ